MTRMNHEGTNARDRARVGSAFLTFQEEQIHRREQQEAVRREEEAHYRSAERVSRIRGRQLRNMGDVVDAITERLNIARDELNAAEVEVSLAEWRRDIFADEVDKLTTALAAIGDLTAPLTAPAPAEPTPTREGDKEPRHRRSPLSKTVRVDDAIETVLADGKRRSLQALTADVRILRPGTESTTLSGVLTRMIREGKVVRPAPATYKVAG